MRHAIVCVAFVTATALSAPAFADANGVGLGVAVGGAYSPTKLQNGELDKEIGGSFAWGFFVDIPLLDTFYISPASMLYELDLGDGKKPVTDIDLNFKFIVPLSSMRLGAGFTAGLTNLAEHYVGHYGVLGYLSFNLVSNIDAFALVQYKRLDRNQANIDDVHAYAGGMFRF